MIESNDSSISFEVESQFPDHNGLRWVRHGLSFSPEGSSIYWGFFYFADQVYPAGVCW